MGCGEMELEGGDGFFERAEDFGEVGGDEVGRRVER